MSDPQTLSGLIASVTGEITQVESSVGHRALGHHKKPPHYTWVPVGGPIDAPRSPATQSPPLRGRWRCRWRVWCWGADMNQATWLVFALLSAAHKALCGRAYSVADVQAHEQTNAEAGFAWVVDLDLFLDVPSMDTTAAPPAPTQNATALVAEVEQKTPALSTPGDGVLEGTES